MTAPAAPSQEMLRHLFRIAHEVRSRVIDADRRLGLRDVYALCYYITKELHGQYPGLRIMVGDRLGEHGLVQHHWLEIPSAGIYLDPACDALDPFQTIRVGKLDDTYFSCTYRNGLDASIDVDDPRNRPEVLYKFRSPWDPEKQD